jgi:hypothetical protein
MKKLSISLFTLLICLLMSTPIVAQIDRAGYSYDTYIDNSVNVMRSTGPIGINTVPGRSGGTGTETDPFIIATVDDLVELATRINSKTEGSSTVFPNGNLGYTNQYFLVTEDLDLSAHNPWVCIGIPGDAIFYGNFNGGGHVVSNLILNPGAGTNQGLFSVLGNNAIVHGIKIKDSQLNGSYYTGGIVGAAGEFTTIYDCHNYSDLTSTGYYTGGIAGASWGTIYNCTNSGNITGNDFCGGIVGDFYGTIYNCVNTGNMSGPTSIAGIIGYSGRADVKNLINTGNITGTGGYVGGVAGFVVNFDTDRTSSYCINMGDVVSPSASSGAVFGRLWAEDGVPSDANNCYYDKQLTLKLGVYPGGDVPDVAEGKFTHEMLGDLLSANLNEDFIFTAGLYPCPAGTEESDITHVAIAPASLRYSSDDDFDRYNDVNDHFGIALDNDVEWSSQDETKMIVAGNSVVLLDTGVATLECVKGDAKKTIELTINTAPPADCVPPVLESVTIDVCSDAPCLLLHFTEVAFVTGGYNIYVDGALLMNVAEWQVVSLTSDDITPNENLCFTVTAVCMSGETDSSNEICETLPSDCTPPILESVVQDICLDAPCLLLHFTEINNATGGYNIYVDGALLMNVAEWQVVSFTSDDITPNENLCFTVTAVCAAGESDFSNEICETLTGIENRHDNKINIYPNPAVSYIHIEGDNIQTISIIDNLGRRINEYHPNGNNMNAIRIEGHTSGFYLIKIEMTDGKYVVKKLVIAK